MTTLIHADIFFFVTTIAVAVLAIVWLVALVYLIKLIREVKNSAVLIKDELELVRDYITSLRKTPSRGAVGAGLVAEGIVTLFNSFKKENKTKTKRYTK